MNEQRIDALARRLGSATSRRSVLKLLAGSLAAALGLTGRGLGNGPATHADNRCCCRCAGDRSCQSADNPLECLRLCRPRGYTCTANQECGADEKTCKPIPTAAASAFLYDGYNSFAVQNGPPLSPTVVPLPTGAALSFIATYHYNYGQGAVPGTLTLIEQDSGVTYGPYQAAGDNGQSGSPSLSWVVNTSLSLPPGTYLVVDSDPSTWSNNAQSGYSGFVRFGGAALPAAAEPTPTPPPAAANPGSAVGLPSARFVGTVTGPGTTVTVSVGGVACWFGFVSSGSYQVDVQALSGCSTPGAVVSFTIDGQPAGPSATLPSVPGTTVQNNLVVTTAPTLSQWQTTATGAFTNGRGACGGPTAFTDTFVLSLAGNQLTISQPSTGDVATGTLSGDGSFSAVNPGKETYNGTLSGATITATYTYTSGGCTETFNALFVLNVAGATGPFPDEQGTYETPGVQIVAGQVTGDLPTNVNCPGSLVIYSSWIQVVGNCAGFGGPGAGNNAVVQTALANANAVAAKIPCADDCVKSTAEIWRGWDCGNNPLTAVGAVEVKITCAISAASL